MLQRYNVFLAIMFPKLDIDEGVAVSRESNPCWGHLNRKHPRELGKMLPMFIRVFLSWVGWDIKFDPTELLQDDFPVLSLISRKRD